jgi:putative pyoverdin transport system ATP-binding/permease protein
LQKTGRTAMKSETELFGFFGHVIDGFKELKLNKNKSADLFLNHLLPFIKKTKSHRIAANDEFVRLITYTNILLYLSTGAIIFVFDWENAHTVFKLFVMYGFLFESIVTILSNLPEITEADVAISRIEALEKELKHSFKTGEAVHSHAANKTSGFKEIEIKNLFFNYTDKKGETSFSLGPINLTIKSGEIIFLTGGNGGGKSTLLKLIPGLYPPVTGIFIIDGRQADMRNYQHLFSAIYTDCYLFDSLYGIDSPDDNKIYELLMAMGLSHKVSWKNRRLNYSGLSSGQKKRLAFIVSLLEDKSVYIFDEWAAEQDPVFRKTFYEELLPSMKAQGKTVIAASHDDRYFHIADKILKMNYGGIEG